VSARATRAGWAAVALRAAWGGLLVAAPHRLLEAGGVDTPGVRGAARVLGGRHLAEALILTRATDSRPRRWISVVDGLHAASMLAVAAVSPRLRRDALTSAAASAALIGLNAGLAPAGRCSRPRPAGGVGVRLTG
jgi:hypothetical protein